MIISTCVSTAENPPHLANSCKKLTVQPISNMHWNDTPTEKRETTTTRNPRSTNSKAMHLRILLPAPNQKIRPDFLCPVFGPRLLIPARHRRYPKVKSRHLFGEIFLKTKPHLHLLCFLYTFMYFYFARYFP